MGGLSGAARKLNIRLAMQLEGIDHVAMSVRVIEQSSKCDI